MVSIHQKSQHCQLSPDSSIDLVQSQSKFQRAFLWKMPSFFLNYIEKKNPRLDKALKKKKQKQIFQISLLDFNNYLKTYNNQDCNIGGRIVVMLISGTEESRNSLKLYDQLIFNKVAVTIQRRKANLCNKQCNWITTHVSLEKET